MALVTRRNLCLSAEFLPKSYVLVILGVLSFSQTCLNRSSDQCLVSDLRTAASTLFVESSCVSPTYSVQVPSPAAPNGGPPALILGISARTVRTTFWDQGAPYSTQTCSTRTLPSPHAPSHRHILSRPWRLTCCREYHQPGLPHDTHNTRGNMATMGSLNKYRGADLAEATEPPPHFQGGPGAASQAQVHNSTGRGAHRDADLAQQGQHKWGSYSPGRQCSHMGVSRELPGQTIIPSHHHTHAHTHTHTHTRTHAHGTWACGAAGCGRSMTTVHSLRVLLRGSKGPAGWDIQTLLQCEQSCRMVMYHSERNCFG